MVKSIIIRNPRLIEIATAGAGMGLGRTPTEAAENLMHRGWDVRPQTTDAHPAPVGPVQDLRSGSVANPS